MIHSHTMTERAKKILDLAKDEADKMGHDYIGVEHILLGIISERASVATEAMLSMGIELEKLACEVRRAACGIGKRMCCWMVRHDSHGLSYNEPVWLEEGDAPETNEFWVRAPWLDQKEET